MAKEPSTQQPAVYEDVIFRALRYICDVFDGTEKVITPFKDDLDEFIAPSASPEALARQKFLMEISMEVVKRYKFANSSGSFVPDDIMEQARVAAERELKEEMRRNGG